MATVSFTSVTGAFPISGDNTAVLKDPTPRKFYTHHTQLTVGVSYLFAR